ncbi:vWA domain-containing protein [Tundrisphaera lichenicola]|uniref:vWA domain-containing protein n=1 Tax=Tundrisphaera lichenicola TaxID=2029860 RepID=UPI003EBEF35E
MWSRVLHRIESRFPGLRIEGRIAGLRQVAGRQLERELPAFGVSLAFHLVILVTLGLVGIAARADLSREITSQFVDTTLPTFDRTELQDLEPPDVPAVFHSIGSSAPNLSALANEGSIPSPVPTSAEGQGPSVKLLASNIARPGELVMPTAATLSQTVSIKGNAAEHVGGVEGAVDRIALELLNRLERGRTLVVWAFDASGSLQAEREKLSKHIEQVYQHIEQLDKDHVASGDALLTMVVAFGQGRKAMLPAPTSDTSAIGEAIRSVPLDVTGEENTFSTVGNITSRWGKYKDSQGQEYQTVIIVVTDEVGEDESRLESAIAAASAAKVPVYVLGSPALFGKAIMGVTYTDPRTKKTHYNVPVRIGPESVALETIHLPFWYGGDRFENLDSGFGPYALSRLAGSTGGIYFITRLGPGRLTLDPNVMREYRPDMVSTDQYARALQKDPIRNAVIQAAQITQQNLPGQPGLTFSSADSPEFKEEMTRNQETVARIAYTVDEALVPITAAARMRDRETSRRWQAHYDLIRGRLLTMKIRCHEYNIACARMKRDAPKFQNPKSNAWQLTPTEEVQSGDKVATVAKEARWLLNRVVEDHPNTPWAQLAQRELKDPVGFKWVETFVPPPPRPSPAQEAAARKKAAMKKDAGPEEVPKI